MSDPAVARSQPPPLPQAVAEHLRPAATPQASQPPQKVRVIVTDIDVSFSQMIWLMVKWSFASIPALIVIGIIGAFLFGGAYMLGTLADISILHR